MASANMMVVIDISSDEEDNVVKKAQVSPQDGYKSKETLNNGSKPSSQITTLADRERPNTRRRVGRCQSMSDLPTQRKSKLPRKRALSELGMSTTAAVSTAETSFSSLHNTNRYQSSRTKNPENASRAMHNPPPITQTPSSQPPNISAPGPPGQASPSPPNRKRKPTALAPDPARKRMKPNPTPAVPPRPPEQPSVPVVSNIDLWSIPKYQEPITISDNASEVPSTIPVANSNNVTKVPVAVATAVRPEPPSTASAPSSSSPKPTASSSSPSRPRRTMWTCAQLANFATALDTSLDIDSFAAANNKMPQQVKETLGFLVLKPIFEYAEEGQKIARKFHKEMKEHQKETEKVMRKVHRKEKREGCWSAEGMPAIDEKRRRAKENAVEKEKGGRKDDGDRDRKGEFGGKKDGVKGKRKGKGPLEMALAGKEKE